MFVLCFVFGLARAPCFVLHFFSVFFSFRPGIQTLQTLFMCVPVSSCLPLPQQCWDDKCIDRRLLACAHHLLPLAANPPSLL